MLLLTYVLRNGFLVREAKQRQFGWFFWLDRQPGTDDKTSAQVVTDGVANVDDMNLPGEDSCYFL